MLTVKDTILNQNVQVVSSPPITEAQENYDLGNVGEVKTEEVPKRIDLSPLDEKDVNTEPLTFEQEVQGQVAADVRAGRVDVSKLDPAMLTNFMHDAIVARPIRLPSMLDVKCKDSNWWPRWVNFKAHSGAMYNDAVAMGFRKAVKDEIVGLTTDLMIQPDGIKYNDVILMVIPTTKLFGAYKYNALRSLQMVGRKGAHRMAAREGEQSLQGVINSLDAPSGAKTEIRRGIGIYEPTEKDFSRF
jgi:hypothetical protein